MAGTDDQPPGAASRDRARPMLRVMRTAGGNAGAKVVGSIVGLGLVAAAAAWAFSRAPLTETLATIAQPDRTVAAHLAVLVAATIGGMALSAEILLRLTRRFGPVGRAEMLALVAASTLLNYLPLRPGLIGRMAWHRMVNGIPTLVVARTVVEATALTAVCVATLVAALLATAWLELPWTVAATMPLAVAATAACVPRTRVYALPLSLRHLEILLWAVRLHVAFALTGVDLAPPATLGLTAAAVSASMIPLVGNGLGLREWTVGALSPLLANVDLAMGLTADLVSRTLEIAVVVPLGLVAIAWLARRRSISVTPAVPRPPLATPDSTRVAPHGSPRARATEESPDREP